MKAINNILVDSTFGGCDIKIKSACVLRIEEYQFLQDVECDVTLRVLDVIKV